MSVVPPATLPDMLLDIPIVTPITREYATAKATTKAKPLRIPDQFAFVVETEITISPRGNTISIENNVIVLGIITYRLR
jgi:hypothetical protein